MKRIPKQALETLKGSVQRDEKAISTLEQYVEELEKRLSVPLSNRPKSESQLDDEERETLEQMEMFMPKTVEDEYRNKLLLRLINNFNLEQLEVIENLGKVHYHKQKNYKDV